MSAGRIPKARALMTMALSMAFASHAAPGIDRDAWRGDLAVLKQTLQDDYAHLAWVASAESGVDLPALERDAQQASPPPAAMRRRNRHCARSWPGFTMAT